MVKVVPLNIRKYQFSFTTKIPLTPLPGSLFKKGLSRKSSRQRLLVYFYYTTTVHYFNGEIKYETKLDIMPWGRDW